MSGQEHADRLPTALLQKPTGTHQCPFSASSTNWTRSPVSRERSRASVDSYVSCTRKRPPSACRQERRVKLHIHWTADVTDKCLMILSVRLRKLRSIYSACHITFTLCGYDLTCLSVTAVRVKPLGIFKETSGTLPAVFVEIKTGIFNQIKMSNPK